MSAPMPNANHDYGYAKHGSRTLHAYPETGAPRTRCGIARERLYHPLNAEPGRAATCRKCFAGEER